MKHFLILVLVSALSACGGGGSSGSAPSQPVTPPVAATSTVSFDMTLNATATGAAAPQWHRIAGSRPAVSGAYTPGFSPADIRAAYNMPALTSATPTQLGYGQTIYILDAYDDPNAAAELALFNKQFNLPDCTFSVVYLDANGNKTAMAPVYNSDWASEIALDVQWAHATAPLARIVLVETADNNNSSFINAIGVINKMGPGVVSMSFASQEDTTSAGHDSLFTGTGITYVAAAGDAGEQVNWPAVSPKVLAVGGTSLYYGQGVRYEFAWTGTGGGSSLYEAVPAYQKTLGGSHRQVSDVSFNADPDTGQPIVQIFPGQTIGVWSQYGGTSLATPQWAGLIAVANSMRADIGAAALGDMHAQLYANEFDFNDITQGSNGACGSCVAVHGYDQSTGLGSPITNLVLPMLVNAPIEPTNTDDLSISISDLFGSFNISDSKSDTIHVTVSGVPANMTFNPNGNTVSIGMTGVTCNCTLSITATDSNSVTATATMNLDIGE